MPFSFGWIPVFGTTSLHSKSPYTVSSSRQTPPAQDGALPFTHMPRLTRPGGHWRQPSTSMFWNFGRSARPFRPSTCRPAISSCIQTTRRCNSLSHTSVLALFPYAKNSKVYYTIGRQVFLHPLRIPTNLNVVADGLSRLEPLNTEWTLPPEAFSAILRWAGPLQVDLLASPTNHRLPQWVSLFPHPDAVACNCLSIDWNGFASIYAFPPVGLIPTLLPLIRGYRGCLVLVAPWDSWAPWLPLLLQHARDHLHLRTTPYQFCGQGQVFHRLGTSARWTAFLFTEGPFSLPACGSGRYALGMLSPFLSASAGSRLDGLSSLVAP